MTQLVIRIIKYNNLPLFMSFDFYYIISCILITVDILYESQDIPRLSQQTHK